jgi:glucose-1-phosphate thymidylyltransferase
VVEDGADGTGAVRMRGAAALEHVANRPIAEHVLDALEGAGVRDVVLVCSSESAPTIRSGLAGRIDEGGLRLRYLEQEGPVDLSGALRLAAPVVGDAPCVVHLAGGLLGEPLAPLLNRMQSVSPDLLLVVHQQPGANERLSPASQDILHIAELHPERASLGMAGVWVFGPGALRHVGEASWRAGADVDLTAVAERIAAANGTFHVRVAEGWRNFRGNPLDLLELNHMVLDRLATDYRRVSGNGNGNGNGPRSGNRIEGRVQIHETAMVSASVIVGPTVIGPGACIADAYIGPYTSVGAGARIEGAEIERSIIAAGASIMHIGGRLVASVVGREARVFRDFSLPRAFRLRVGDGTEVSLC